MRSAATLAIAAARARTLRPAAATLVICSIAGGAVIGRLIFPVTWMAANIIFSATIAIVIAYVSDRAARRDLFAAIDEAAPLFGRQRARANAIFPALIVVACTLAQYAAAAFQRPDDFVKAFFLINEIAALTALPIALSAPLRSPRNAALYAAISIGAAFLCAAFGAAILDQTASAAAAVFATASLALIISFVALRQYGEALARYDPLPSGS